jgi:hypothetical protein
MKEMAPSSDRSVMSSATADSASVLSQIHEIESSVLNQTIHPRDSVKMLLQLNQMKLNLLEGEQMEGVDNDDANDENDGEDEDYRQRIRSRSPRSVRRSERAGFGAIGSESLNSNIGPGRIPFLISTDDGDEASSFVSSLDCSLRTPRPSMDRKPLDGMRTMGPETSMISRISESDHVVATPDLRIVKRTGPPPTSSIVWDALAYVVTFAVPDFCIPGIGPGAKKAWREKVTIFAIFLLISACFVILASVFPTVFCPETEGYFDAVEVLEGGYVSLFGVVYDLRPFSQSHFQSSKTLDRYFGQDASHLFPRLPPARLPPICLNTMLGEEAFNETNAYGLQNITCLGLSIEEELRYGNPCHTSIVGKEQINASLWDYEIGYMVVSKLDLHPTGLPDGTQFILIDNTVYNVTQYVAQSRYVHEPGSLQ